jgi:hypothetical protein
MNNKKKKKQIFAVQILQLGNMEGTALKNLLEDRLC